MKNADYNETLPGSVADQMNHEPNTEMNALFWRNKLKFEGDQRAMEDWATDGFVSIPRNHDLREEDLVGR